MTTGYPGGMGAARDPETHMRYDELRDALEDADRVASMVLDQMDGQLVVPTQRVEFLSRRLRDLVLACLDALDLDEKQARP